ncbi:hypothetical protein [Streptosporangium vulgare]|uniref:hypothetical protein n=1 Tax=Streptosporangium vulgare TaxID=46190 RepID=UPI0031D46F64
MLICSHTRGGLAAAAIAVPTAVAESTREAIISRRLDSVYRQFTLRPAQIDHRVGAVDLGRPIPGAPPVPGHRTSTGHPGARAAADDDHLVARVPEDAGEQES